jgi:hypothetical protein
MKNIKVVKVLRDMQSAFNHGTYRLHYMPHTLTFPLVGKFMTFRISSIQYNGHLSILEIPCGRLKMKSLGMIIV